MSDRADWLSPLESSRFYTCVYDRFSVPLVIFEHHRFTLPVIWLAKRAGILTEAVPLVYFDHHPDLLTSPDINAHAAFFAQAESFDDVVRYTEERMSVCNDDWVRTAVACGLVSTYTHVAATEQPLPLHDGAWWCDLDLDYFTDEAERKRIVPWTTDRMVTDVRMRKQFWSHAAKTVPCVTVARESEFCGGGEAMKKTRNDFFDALARCV